MKSILAALLLCGVITCGGAVILQDEKFTQLFNAARQLDQLATEWNQTCGNDIDNPDCKEMKLKIDVIESFWLAEARKYVAVGDDTACDTLIRQKLINLHVRMFEFNLQYAGRKLTQEEQDKSADICSAIKTDELQLRKDIDECKNRNNTQSDVINPPEYIRL